MLVEVGHGDDEDEAAIGEVPQQCGRERRGFLGVVGDVEEQGRPRWVKFHAPRQRQFREP